MSNWGVRVETIGEFLASAGGLRSDAEVILSRILKKDRSFLVAHPETKVPDEAQKMLERRKNGEPLAYILGVKEFFGRNFLVNRDVLIPRPETEVLVELALKRIKEVKLATGEFVTVVDVGTGSGAIAATVALEAERPVNVIGLDISDKALKVAGENCERLGARVRLMESDLLEVFDGQIESRGGLVVIANLPYVNREWEWLSPELKYEPELALYAGADGLAVVKDFLEQANQKMQNGFIYLEADPCQHAEIRRVVEALGMKLIKIEGFAMEIER